MVKVIGVRFKKAYKIYFFDPDGLEVEAGQHVIVETARGVEYGSVVLGIREIPESDIVSPLKKVLRIATDEDTRIHQENIGKKEEALRQCEEKIVEHELDMNLIDVEYTFDNNKVIFYFTADGRVDFRELVKDLASIFRMRIELRQIGVRDEAKMINGLGPCGREMCCANWLADFAPVSIKMAKEQNLSLNPAKISGACGRLMCCLKYEYETYIQIKKGLPNKGDHVMTPDGKALVVDKHVIHEAVKVRHILKDGDLSEDLVTYSKEVVRIINKNKKRQNEPKQKLSKEELTELKQLQKGE